MKASDRTILITLTGLGLLAAFWLLVISPKRDEAASLSDTADELRASVSSLQAQANAGEAARDRFPKHYQRMVVLGKAVPAGDDEADLIIGLQRIGEQADVEFRSIVLGAGGTLPTPEIQRPNPVTGEDPGQEESTEPSEPSATAAAVAQPTEAAAATLPIGAVVGAAGLGVMPWELTFDGGFFDLSSVFAQIDRTVSFSGPASKVRGRLVTVDGFSLTRLDDNKVPRLKASVAVRSYVTPEGESVMLGATPEGPATTPVSAEVTP